MKWQSEPLFPPVEYREEGVIYGMYGEGDTASYRPPAKREKQKDRECSRGEQ